MSVVHGTLSQSLQLSNRGGATCRGLKGTTTHHLLREMAKHGNIFQNIRRMTPGKFGLHGSVIVSGFGLLKQINTQAPIRPNPRWDKGDP